MINDYWKFDNHQQPMSSWHDKQDLLKAIEEVLPQADVIKSVCEHQTEKYGKCIKCGEQVFNKSYDNEQTV